MALAIVSGTAYLTHYAAIGIGLIQLSIFLVTFRTTYRSFRWWVLAQGMAVVPAGSWLALSMMSHGYSGIRGSWISTPSLLAPAKTLWNFSLGCDGRFTVLTASVLPVFALALWAGTQRRSESIWDCSMVAWLIVLPSVSLGTSFLVVAVYVDRYLGVCVPAYLQLLSAGVVAFPMPKLRVALGAFQCRREPF